MSKVVLDRPDNLRLIIGLGNPGPKFERTRHNIGFRVLDALAVRLGGVWEESRMMLLCSFTATEDRPYPLYLVKPLTFMNNSGEVLPSFIKKGIKSDEVLVVHDELEKKFGSLAIRLGGSARGHNGLRSIVSYIGYNFWRLRVGISRPDKHSEVSSYVLAPFSVDQERVIDAHINRAVDEILSSL